MNMANIYRRKYRNNKGFSVDLLLRRKTLEERGKEVKREGIRLFPQPLIPARLVSGYKCPNQTQIKNDINPIDAKKQSIDFGRNTNVFISIKEIRNLEIIYSRKS